MTDSKTGGGEGQRPLAYHHRKGKGPTIVFLPGYMSDMEGSKALALDAWAQGEGRAFIRFDYGGCGASPGEFEEQTMVDWRDDAVAIVDYVAEGSVVLVGSSMGGWLMLHVAMARPDRVVGMVGVAAAPDFTAWGFSEQDKLALLQHGRLERPNDYADTPQIVTRAFWQSGESMRLLHSQIAIDCPVRLLQGQRDTDVPWAYAMELAKQLRSDDVQAIVVKDGDHRLSRDRDIALLIRTLKALVEET
jgi:pimeloyl-ACP methyl ester carboxylesterase